MEDGGAMMNALFNQIRFALEGDVPSDEIGRVLAEVREEIGRQRAARSKHEAASINVLADHAEVVEADRALSETMLNERRLTEAVRQLDLRLAVVREVETERVRAAAYQKARAIRDAALIEVSLAWSTHVKGLIGLLDRIAEVDDQIAATCDKPPKGADALGNLLAGIYSMGSTPNLRRPIAEHLSLPAVPVWDAPGFTGNSIVRM